MDVIQNISQSIGPWVGAHPVAVIIIVFSTGLLVGRLLFGSKKPKK